jgi:hypothetical protein
MTTLSGGFIRNDAAVVRQVLKASTATGASAVPSSAREVMPSFGNVRYKCVLMVRCERNSRWPISRFDRPCAASRAICSSCAVSWSRASGTRRRLRSPDARAAPARSTARTRAHRTCHVGAQLIDGDADAARGYPRDPLPVWVYGERGAQERGDELCRRLSYADEAQADPPIDYQLPAPPSATNQKPGGEGQ